jgi:hypothetical protein
MPRYTRIKKLASFFRNLITCHRGQLDLLDGRERTGGEILALLTGADAPATRQAARAPTVRALHI